MELKSLNVGDTIGIIAPSGVFKSERLMQGLKNLQQIGNFQFRYGLSLHDRVPLIPETEQDLANYDFAGSDGNRVESIMEMFLDEQVKAIFCVRGGHGALRILDWLDYDIIKTHPKIFMGFSDITAYLVAIYQRCGFSTFHGPMIQHDFGRPENELSAPTIHSFQSILMSHKPFDVILVGAIFGGYEIRGKLIGGNLAILTSLLETPFSPDFSDAVLFIEDVNEPIYRIDRMLHQLRLTGKLKNIRGIIFGQTPFKSENIKFLEVIAQTLQVPVAGFLPFGHGFDNIVLPLGGEITIRLLRENQLKTIIKLKTDEI